MHALTVQVQDSVFQEFLSFISKRKESIKIWNLTHIFMNDKNNCIKT